MPMRLGDNLEKSNLSRHRFEETWREAEIHDNSRGTFPFSKDRQTWWRDKDIPAVNVVMV